MMMRLCKIGLVGSVGFFLLLVVFNNLTDYGSNFEFVARVLSMDTTFEDNAAKWRALRSPAAHHVFYGVIIAWEAAAAGLCLAGTSRLWRTRTAPATVFNRAKSLAVAGLTVSLLQWWIAFLSIGGEWFLMWQSRTWNGQDAAFRMFASLALVLIFLALEDPESPTASPP